MSSHGKTDHGMIHVSSRLVPSFLPSFLPAFVTLLIVTEMWLSFMEYERSLGNFKRVRLPPSSCDSSHPSFSHHPSLFTSPLLHHLAGSTPSFPLFRHGVVNLKVPPKKSSSSFLFHLREFQFIADD